MKSYAHTTLPLKKIKKLAAGFSDDDIRASLGPYVDRCFLMEGRGTGSLVHYWSDSGPIVEMNDDSVLAYAQIQYLKRNQFPVFKTDDELAAYAQERGWPQPKG